MSKFSFSISSIAAGLSAAYALANDVKPLFDLAAKAMTALEATPLAGPDKKTSVLNIVSLAASEAGKDVSAIMADISAFIDLAKTLYNDTITAATDLKAALAPADPRPQPQPE